MTNSAPTSSPRRIRIVPPSRTGEKLVFRAFDNVCCVGYARLTRLKAQAKNDDRVVDLFNPNGRAAYELKMIEVAQNYRHAGVGTTLLQEVIRFCRDNAIEHLRGEIKGDIRTLGPWYRHNGFAVDHRNRLTLLPTAS